HRPMTRQDCILKLGQEIVDNYQVRNHHVYENLAYLGKTQYNTPIFVNRDFLTADVKVCVGSINPHGGPGFGGGAKLVLPGVAGIESLYNNHRSDIPPHGGLNEVDDNAMRADMEEFARRAGLTAIVNVVVNEKREIVACVVGDVVAAHRVGVGLAREVFATPVPRGWDVGVFSTYPKDVEWVQAGMAFNVWHSAQEPIVHASGTIVLACASSEGAGYHSLYGPEMRLGASRGSMKHPFGNRHFIIFSPNINQFDLNPATRADAVLCRTWAAVVAELRKRHGTGTKVAVFPCAAIQLAV
ncbi:MAG: lactate racemase domain-containing protein, partial [Abditibacteriales bacterium]|nr:lactate racemase domain-containing protein [Abditibacteriales bacterium]MDW8365880.1 lactate racemase domain-containing protein [Abditibacteriales bacterium]